MYIHVTTVYRYIITYIVMYKYLLYYLNFRVDVLVYNPIQNYENSYLLSHLIFYVHFVPFKRTCGILEDVRQVTQVKIILIKYLTFEFKIIFYKV